MCDFQAFFFKPYFLSIYREILLIFLGASLSGALPNVKWQQLGMVQFLQRQGNESFQFVISNCKFLLSEEQSKGISGSS